MNVDITNFNKISVNKQKTVINAGFLCFGQNGYNKTSIADIASVAGISKASIFQYFGNKRDMYLFLYDFAGKEVARRIPEGTSDFFECVEKYIKSIMEASKDYPNIFDFLVIQSQRKDFSDIEGIIEVESDVYKHNVNTLFENVDWSKLKDGFDKIRVQNIFDWIIRGCMAQLSLEMSTEQVFEETLIYLQLMKSVIYRTL